MPVYEIRAVGAIGPVVASIFPGFTTGVEPAYTVLSGTVADADQLLAVLNLLRARGFSPFDTRISAEELTATAAESPERNP